MLFLWSALEQCVVYKWPLLYSKTWRMKTPIFCIVADFEIYIIFDKQANFTPTTRPTITIMAP